MSDRTDEENTAPTSEPETADVPAPPAQEAERPDDGPTTADGGRTDEDEDEVISEELMEIARELGAKPEKVKAFMHIVAESWTGPLPHPRALASYNDAYDGCARDIVKMSDRQALHRQTVEATVIGADIKLRQRGQYCGFVLGMLVIVGGFSAILAGRSVAGFSTILLALVSLVGLFIYGRKGQTTELDEKRRALEDAVEQIEAHGMSGIAADDDDEESDWPSTLDR